MPGIKVRRFTLLATDKDGSNQLTITVDKSNLGFNPSHGYKKAQIATNTYDAAGTFSVDFRPSGCDFFLPFVSQEGQAADAGEDIVIIGRDEDALFDALKLTFSGVAASDVELYIGFINDDEKI
jgi:hypothetical protein